MVLQASRNRDLLLGQAPEAGERLDGQKRPYPGKKGKPDHTYYVISCPRYVNDSEPTMIIAQKKMSDSEKEDVIRRLKSGEIVASIARSMGRPVSTIRYYKEKYIDEQPR